MQEISILEETYLIPFFVLAPTLNISSKIFLPFYRKVCRNCKCPKEDHQASSSSAGFIDPLVMSAGAQPNLVQPPGSETPGGSSPTTSGTSSANGNALNNSIDSANPKSLSGTGSTLGSGGTTNSADGNHAGSGTVDIPRQIPNQHSDDDSGCALEEYTWVPPGLKPDQVRFPSIQQNVYDISRLEQNVFVIILINVVNVRSGCLNNPS